MAPTAKLGFIWDLDPKVLRMDDWAENVTGAEGRKPDSPVTTSHTHVGPWVTIGTQIYLCKLCIGHSYTPNNLGSVFAYSSRGDISFYVFFPTIVSERNLNASYVFCSLD